MSMLWQRFTERAKRVVIAAQEETASAGERYVSPEHLLLGLVKPNDSVATKVLERLGTSADRVRREIERQIGRGCHRLDNSDVTFDRRMKDVLTFAHNEQRQTTTKFIGTEHLLLGILREGDGIAYRTLTKLGIDLAAARKEVASYLAGEAGPRPAPHRLGYEVRKYRDPIEATAWLNNMITQGFKLTYCSTNSGELWLVIEGLIPIPEAPKNAEATGDSGAANTPEKPWAEEGWVNSK